ncbi:MAG: hypothetical protein ABI678_04135 [Kofleriaceae bacterium]
MVTRAFIVVALAGCTSALDQPAPVTALDREMFRCAVEPVLAARCAFPGCHGDARRPLAIYAPGRMRYAIGWDRPTEPLTDAELGLNYDIAAGFATSSATGTPWLLAKPLAVEAGGYFHRGAELDAAGDVFASTDDAGYRLLARWIAGETAATECTPTFEVGP